MSEEFDKTLPNEYDSEKDKVIWDEYHYRHEQIWSLLIKITTAVVAVSILPYIADDDITRTLKYGIIWPPLIGLLLIWLSYSRLKHEVEILKGIKDLHRLFHTIKYNIPYKKDSLFWTHLQVYLSLMFILGIINVCLILFLWIPHIIEDEKHQEQQSKELLENKISIQIRLHQATEPHKNLFFDQSLR